MSIFDSSAIYKAIGISNVSLLAGECTVPLALYELGNIVLKNSLLFKKYSSREAHELLRICETTLNTMRVISPDNWEHVYQIAVSYQLSFYDATYVCLAKRLNMSLVTLDKKLANKAHHFVDIILFENFIK